MSAHKGSGHFFRQRFSAVLLVPLVVWFVYVVARYTGADHATVKEFLGEPINAGLMVALILVGVYHFASGMQVVIEDYIAAPGSRMALMFLTRLFSLAVAVAAALAASMLAGWITL